MSVEVTRSITIHCPLAKVSDYSANPDNVRFWYKNIKQVEWCTAKPLAIGSKVAFVAHFLGRKMSYTYEVVEWQPNDLFVMRTSQGPFPMETMYSWSQSENNTTLMTLTNRGEPKGFSKLMAPLMSWAMGRAMQKDLLLLKGLLEQR